MKKVVADRPDIAFFLKLMLLKQEPATYETAKTIVCSKSVKVLEDAFEGKPLPKQDCPSKELDNNIAFTEQNGINAVPAIILPDGSIQPGYLEAPVLVARIDEASGQPGKKAAQGPVKPGRGAAKPEEKSDAPGAQPGKKP